MVVILLAALGVPLGLVLGLVIAGIWSRKRFQKTPGVFAVKVRPAAGNPDGPAPKWPRRPAYARWVHDVLLVHQGLALLRNRALPVASVSPDGLGPGDVGGLGDDPVVVRVHLDSGETLDIAAKSSDRDALVGPFREQQDPLSR